MGFDSWETSSNRLLESLTEAVSCDTETEIDGEKMLNLGSNNYLGLARKDMLVNAAADAAEEYGTGSGASGLVCGHLEPHRLLERAIAEYKGTENALVFSSGYATNVGVLSSLMKDGGVIFSDELNHASIVDGCRMSNAEVRRYNHCDPEDLREKFNESNADRKLVVTDSVFSLDGDTAPLNEISEIVNEDEAGLLMVDEAHATGVLGDSGSGLIEKEGLRGEVDIQMGTLSKALASQGGFIAASNEVRRYLFNNARSFMFSTCLNPPAAAVAKEAIDIANSGRGDNLRENLHRNASILREGVEDAGYETIGDTHIVPAIIGEKREAMKVAQLLYSESIFSPAYRPPAVPQGTSRIRLSPTAEHKPEEVKRAVEVLRKSKA